MNLKKQGRGLNSIIEIKMLRQMQNIDRNKTITNHKKRV